MKARWIWLLAAWACSTLDSSPADSATFSAVRSTSARSSRVASAQITPLSKVFSPKPYDPAPFEQGIRPHYRDKPRARMGIGSLGQLPLYQIEMELNAVEGLLKVHQRVHFQNPWNERLEDLVLRVYPNAAHLVKGGRKNLTLDEATVNGRPVAAGEINPTTWRIPLPAPLNKGDRVQVGLIYEARVPRLPDRAVEPLANASLAELLKRITSKQAPEGYGVFGAARGIFNLGFFYPILPARSDGSWDTAAPASMGDVAHFDVANYLVKLKLPNTMRVASSGLKVGERPLGSGEEALKEVFLLGTALRNFALQISSRYAVAKRTVDGVRVRYFHVEEHARSAERVLAYATESLRAYQKLFGPYPYPELDVAQAALVGGAGGMEYPGLVTVAVSLAESPGARGLADLMGGLLRQNRVLEFTVAHEVAHQWWHALVGSDSNRHPFLDEAMANYSPILYFEARYGKQAAAEQKFVQLTTPYQLYRLMGGKDGVVDRPTKQFRSRVEYAALVYGKGALFFQALHKLLGDKKFFKFLRSYASKHAFRQAEPKQLVRLAAKVSGKPKRVRSLYRRWIHQRHADQDIGIYDDAAAMKDAMRQIQQLQTLLQGQGLDPAMLQMLQQTVQQTTGP